MMRRTIIQFLLFSLVFVPALFEREAFANEAVVVHAPPPVAFVDRASATVQDVIDQALDLLGIRYRRGGSTPESGLDCSGFVSHAFREGLGLMLPHNAKAISEKGEKISREELRPGDLVFFNTMRKAFSHVGIYLGQNHFVHAPSSGGQVRIEDMRESYWTKRFNGARRIAPE